MICCFVEGKFKLTEQNSKLCVNQNNNLCKRFHQYYFSVFLESFQINFSSVPI